MTVKRGFEYAPSKTGRSRRDAELRAEAVQAAREHRKRQFEEEMRIKGARSRIRASSSPPPRIPPSGARTSTAAAPSPCSRKRTCRTSGSTTSASPTLVDGADLDTVSKMLGYASINTMLGIHAHVIPACSQGRFRLRRTVLVARTGTKAPRRRRSKVPAKRNPAICGVSLCGETGTRTRDTMIFSHVLYQLSYLALWTARRGRALGDSRARGAPYQGRGPLLWAHPPASSDSGYFLEKRFSSKADSTISLGRAPTTALGCSPGSKRAMVGMLEMPK